MISIIIPVYNCENYLHRCLDSCISQTYSKIEIIAINDGSTDSSDKILEEYKKKDSRIKVYHKKNEGVAITRLTGLKKAKGDFFCFVDSDDFLPYNSLEILHDHIIKTKADITVANYYEYYNNNQIIYYRHPYPLLATGYDYIKLMLSDKIPNSLCGKLYSKKINTNLKATTFKLGEDATLLVQFLSQAKLVSYINYPIYYYFQRADSAVHKKKPTYIIDMYTYRLWITDFLIYNKIVKSNHKLLYLFTIRGYINCLLNDGVNKYLINEYIHFKPKYSKIHNDLYLWEKIIFITSPYRLINSTIINILNFIKIVRKEIIRFQMKYWKKDKIITYK